MVDSTKIYNMIKDRLFDCVQSTFALIEKEYSIVVPDEIETDGKVEDLADYMTNLVVKEVMKTNTTEIYYSIMNIVDFLALHEVEKSEKEKLIATLDTLLSFTGETIEEISHANDCNWCSNWEQFIFSIADQHKQGLRSPIE